MTATDDEVGVRDIDGARMACSAGRHEQVKSQTVRSMSLGAMLEAACWLAESPTVGRPIVEAWQSSVVDLRDVISALVHRSVPTPLDEHGAPELEIRACPRRQDFIGGERAAVEWSYFLDRFRRSLIKRLGMPPRRAAAIRAALCEMADNAVQHAGLGDAPDGVVAYRVAANHFEIAVADLGCGVLASLRQNLAHKELRSEAAALAAAVLHGASRRLGTPGTGFADLARALADLAGTLSFRSGDARLDLDGASSSDRVEQVSNSLKMRGFQMSVRVAG